MHNIRDLQLQRDIIPLFDHVNNPWSRDALYSLFEEPPPSLGEILERQGIFRGLLSQQHLFIPIPYSKTEMAEIRDYIRELGDRGSAGGTVSLVPFFVSRRRFEQERGRLTQLLHFLLKIDRSWFQPLNESIFPTDFQTRIGQIRQLFTALELQRFQDIGRIRSLSAREMRLLTARLDLLIREGVMDSFWRSFAFFDACLSVAKGISRHRLNFPVFTTETLSLEECYHPLLKDPVRNDLTFHRNLILLTGPNMSGKSTLLKSIGICIYLAHLGMAVPAWKCETPFFDLISINTDLTDDIRSGYSHFMTEINNLKQVLLALHQTKRCLAIFDELFRGTNVEDALVISGATVEGLTQYVDSRFIISTHLHQLKQTLTQKEGISIRHIGCGLSDGLPAFTYKLGEGWSDLRIGQVLFEREGLNGLLQPNYDQTSQF